MSTLKKDRIFLREEGRFESFLAFVQGSRTQAIVRSESKTDPPNLYIMDLATGARKINEPILLIHGEADNNSGTFPIQSERLFQALRGNGGWNLSRNRPL